MYEMIASARTLIRSNVSKTMLLRFRYFPYHEISNLEYVFIDFEFVFLNITMNPPSTNFYKLKTMV